jgi:hypothetical protein
MARRVVGADRQHVDGKVVDLRQVDVVHPISLVAETRKNVMQDRLPAVSVACSDGGMKLLVLFFAISPWG